MDYKGFFIELISSFLSGSLSKEEVEHKIAMELPIDSLYKNDTELMNNCEWAIRHINEPDYWTIEAELQYYLSCLKGYEEFYVEERNRRLKTQI